MKIAFGPNDYVEMIGSGKNGELTKQELDIFKFTLERRSVVETPVTESITEDTTDEPCEIDRCICDIDDNTEENSSIFDDKRTLMKDFYESPFYGILKEVMQSDNMDKVKCKVSIKKFCAYFPIVDFSTGVRIICIDTEILDRFKFHPLLLDRKLPFSFRIPKCGIKTRIIYSDICHESTMTVFALKKLILADSKN